MLLEGVKQCIFIEEIGKIKTIRDWRDEGKEENLVSWRGLTFDLCWDRSATQIVETWSRGWAKVDSSNVKINNNRDGWQRWLEVGRGR